MSGALAALSLPDDHRLHVQLTPYFYASTLAKVRRDIIGDRNGTAVIEITMPVTAPVIQIVQNRRSLYILGFREVGAAAWWAFQEPGQRLPVMPGGVSRAIGLNGGYNELGLPLSINMPPQRMLNLLAAFNGKPDPEFCRALVLLLFLMAEGLRFDDVLMACVAYFSAGTPSVNTIHPAAFSTIVKKWAGASGRNVLVSHLPK